MMGIRNRVIWLHVNLPGQEAEAVDLKIRKYPSLEEIAEELVIILDYLKIPQVVCMGEGAGANISTYFAIKHPSRCLGVVLIEPYGSSATIMESIRHKISNFNLFTKLHAHEKASILFNRLVIISFYELHFFQMFS